MIRNLFKKSNHIHKIRCGKIQKVSFSNTSEPEGAKRNIWPAALFATACGAGALWYVDREMKQLKSNQKEASVSSIGTAQIGGHINGLIDVDGKPYDSSLDKNTFHLLYFGFTHCPDVCPEELEKIGKVIEQTNEQMKNRGIAMKVKPLFITVDPARDTPETIKEYLNDFHPSIKGLTGSMEDIKRVCKQYRVYFRPAKTSSSQQLDANDYLIDHSIFVFLSDPEGRYVMHFGKESSVDRYVKIITEALETWEFTNK